MALGEQGGGGGAVARGVGGLGGDLLHHLGAHVLIGIGELDLLGDGHAVLGDGRRAEFLVDDDVAALGPEGHLDRTREKFDAAQDLLAGGFFENELFGRHSGKNSGSGFWVQGSGFAVQVRIAEDVVLADEGVFLLLDLHLGAAVLADQHAVADLDFEGPDLAVLVPLAGAEGDDLGLLRFFLGAVRDDDASADLLFFLEVFNENTIADGLDFDVSHSG